MADTKKLRASFRKHIEGMSDEALLNEVRNATAPRESVFDLLAKRRMARQRLVGILNEPGDKAITLRVGLPMLNKSQREIEDARNKWRSIIFSRPEQETGINIKISWEDGVRFDSVGSLGGPLAIYLCGINDFGRDPATTLASVTQNKNLFAWVLTSGTDDEAASVNERVQPILAENPHVTWINFSSDEQLAEIMTKHWNTLLSPYPS